MIPYFRLLPSSRLSLLTVAFIWLAVFFIHDVPPLA